MKKTMRFLYPLPFAGEDTKQIRTLTVWVHTKYVILNPDKIGGTVMKNSPYGRSFDYAQDDNYLSFLLRIESVTARLIEGVRYLILLVGTTSRCLSTANTLTRGNPIEIFGPH